MTTVDLRTVSEKKKVREFLTAEQNNLCALTGCKIEKSQHVLDHAHDERMLVRGVISRQANSILGVIENAWKRYMSWWYHDTLPNFLRKCADYLENDHDVRWRHDHWLKSVKTRFNKLNSKQKDSVLQLLNQPKGRNDVERKKIFAKAILDRSVSYETIVDYIAKAN